MLSKLSWARRAEAPFRLSLASFDEIAVPRPGRNYQVYGVGRFPVSLPHLTTHEPTRHTLPNFSMCMMALLREHKPAILRMSYRFCLAFQNNGLMNKYGHAMTGTEAGLQMLLERKNAVRNSS